MGGLYSTLGHADAMYDVNNQMPAPKCADGGAPEQKNRIAEMNLRATVWLGKLLRGNMRHGLASRKKMVPLKNHYRGDCEMAFPRNSPTLPSKPPPSLSPSSGVT
jgi:hypothetical protein